MNGEAVQKSPVLDIQGVSITYNPGEWNERRVLADVGLGLESGAFLVLTGVNGSGKSTLLRALTHDLEHAEVSGKVLLDGQDLLTLPAQEHARQVAVIDQDPALGTCEHLLVREQLMLAGSKVEARVQARLQDMGSSIGLDQRIQNLSGGQRQLLAALIAIERQPKLLLADEPTAALDSNFAPHILELLLERAGAPGLCTIIVSHQPLELAATLAVRRVRIEDGQLLVTT